MILIVGEQANIQYPFKRVITPDMWYDQRCCQGRHEGSVVFTGVGRRLGAFRGNSNGLCRLASLCPILGEASSMNLCPPGRERSTRDDSFMDQVAAMIRDDDRWHRVVICGRRAARCFGIDWPCYWGSLVSGRYVVMPHPSGRNRWWNRGEDDLERLMTVELSVRSLVDDRYVIGVCRCCAQPIIEMDSASGLCPIHEVMI